METNYLELATNAIAIELVKSTHENQNAPVHTVNERVSHWEISAVTIHGTPIEEWCAQFGLNLDYLKRWRTQFKTKKEALPSVVEAFAEWFSYFYCPEHNWSEPEEVLDRLYAAVDSLKAGN
jgi:hypothetical protein